MRIPLLCLVLLAACAGGEKTPEPPAAPPALTAADVSGTWAGSSMAPGSDSVVATWTITMTSDSTGTFAMEGAPDLPYTVVFGGDSAIATSASYVDPNLGTDMVMWQSVGRLDSTGTFGGSFTTMLAEKHDSVVARGTWRATRKP